jgi:hypothetical protein
VFYKYPNESYGVPERVDTKIRFLTSGLGLPQHVTQVLPDCLDTKQDYKLKK